MTIGVYGIFDSYTNECLYIGQSSNIEYRWRMHRYLLINNKHIRKDFNQWLIDNGNDIDRLRFTILETCNNIESIKNSLEIHYFEFFKPKFYGKLPSVNDKWEHSDETKNKISKSKTSQDYFRLEQNKDLIIEMARNKSISRAQACKELNVSLSLLKKFIKLNSIVWDKKLDKINSENFSKLEYLVFEKKMSTRQIANILKVSQPSIMKHIAKMKDNPRYKDFQNKDLKRFYHRTDEQKEKFSVSMKNLAESKCKYCERNIKINNINRHEESCITFPRCTCGQRLSKRNAKQCLNCYRKKN